MSLYFNPFRCIAVNYYVNSGKCELMSKKPVKEPVEVASRKKRQIPANLIPQAMVDCYFSNCEGFTGFTGGYTGQTGGSLPLPPTPYVGPGPLPFPPQPPTSPSNVQTICNFDGLKVLVRIVAGVIIIQLPSKCFRSAEQFHSVVLSS